MAERTTTSRLLIVAGAPEERAALRRLLGRVDPGAGARAFAVEAVATGAEALEAVRAGGVDAVVLADRPPEVDALRLLVDWAAPAPAPAPLVNNPAPVTNTGTNPGGSGKSETPPQPKPDPTPVPSPDPTPAPGSTTTPPAVTDPAAAKTA